MAKYTVLVELSS